VDDIALYRVLLVEDDEDDYVIACALLGEIEHTTYQIDWARTVAEGIDALSRNVHDVALVDFALGEHTGVELVAQARACGFTGSVVMLTGQSDRETDLAAMRAGAADYLLKTHLSAPLLERAIRYNVLRRRAEQERERLIAELRDAVTRIRTLQGLLPICSACKKIRDDHGYWNQIEEYLRKHSEAEFTHSLCPECLERLYPEAARAMRKREERG